MNLLKKLWAFKNIKICHKENKDDSGEDLQEENSVFQTLGAFSKESPSIYDDALDFAFSEDSIYNIALSGSYGAGKSTIIETYKKKVNKNFLHISLGHFNEDFYNSLQEEGNNLPNLPKEQSLIEGKILNQLIHQIPEEKIPRIIFKIKKEKASHLSTLGHSFFLSASFLSFIYLFNFLSWKQYINNLPSFLSGFSSYLTLISSIILVSFMCYCSYRIIKAQRNNNIFRKININGNEIELFQEENTYFDKYLNEILYILNNAEKDIIVFEDLDRYEISSSIIFERLREINFLINRYLADKDKKIVFLYLIRDDLFSEKERTKFFDFIIPVIPVVDSQSSFEIMLESVDNLQIRDNLSPNLKKSFDSFLRDISLYIDDYRIIKSIFNEFEIYKRGIFSKLNSLSLEKMLSLVIYKNIFPEDFAGLAFRKGFVYSLLNEETKEKIGFSELDKNRQAREELVQEKNQAEKLILYKEFVESIKPKKGNYYNVNSNLINKIYDLEEKISTLEGDGKQLQEEILELDKDKEEIQKNLDKGLKYLITDDNREEIFHTNTFYKENKKFDYLRKSHYFNLIKYLLSNGYIDESYHDYISYFYPNSLSFEDKEFLLSIKNKKGKRPTYPLKNIPLILESLKKEEFKQKEAINYDLMNYFLINSESSEDFHHIVYQLRNNISYFKEYYEQYCNKDKRHRIVIRLNIKDSNFFIELKKDSIVSKNTSLFLDYILLTLSYNVSYTLEKMNKENKFNEVILEQEESLFLRLEEKYKKQIYESLNTLAIKFNKLGTHLDEIWDHVYRNSLYKITFNNISYILQKEYGIENEEDIQAKNYSLIREKKTSPLYKYIEANIEKYCSIILKISGKIEDEEEAIEEILNHGTLSQETKEKYIKRSSGKIENISSIGEKDLWSLLMESLTVSYTMENIVEYFTSYLGEAELDDSLISFINEGEGNLILPAHLEEAKNTTLFSSIVKSEEINDQKYRACLKAFNGLYSPYFSLPDIPSSKFKILVDLSVVKLKEDDADKAKKTLSFIRTNYSKEDLFCFIKKNLEKYLELEDFTQEEILELLALEIEDNKKIKLISHAKEPISIQELNLSSTIQEHILRNHFYEEDIHYLVNHFNSLSANKDYLLTFFLDYEQAIEENLDSLPESLIQKVMGNSKFSKDIRGTLLMKRDFIEKIEIKDFLENWDSTFFNAIYTYKQNQFIPKNPLNEQILNFLKEKEIIRDFYIPEGRNDFKAKGIKTIRIENKT